MNPRAAINDLLPFQGSPFGQLGYFSKLPYLFYLVLAETTISIISYLFSFVKRFLIYFSNLFCSTNGEGGIRTHAPLRTNGFQDRLVMTTSIPLQSTAFRYFLAFCISASDSLSSNPLPVKTKITFFSIFLLTFFFYLFSTIPWRKKASAIIISSGVVILIFS